MLEKPIKGCVSPVYTAFRAKPHWHHFVDLMIKQPQIRKTIEVYCSGSVRQVLRFEDFCRIEIKLPHEKKVLEFNEIYESLLNKINHNKQQIKKLTGLRDAILPRLMTGKIEIKN
jgi:type I restriction enzyme S subunit